MVAHAGVRWGRGDRPRDGPPRLNGGTLGGDGRDGSGRIASPDIVWTEAALVSLATRMTVIVTAALGFGSVQADDTSIPRAVLDRFLQADFEAASYRGDLVRGKVVDGSIEIPEFVCSAHAAVLVVGWRVVSFECKQNEVCVATVNYCRVGSVDKTVTFELPHMERAMISVAYESDRDRWRITAPPVPHVSQAALAECVDRSAKLLTPEWWSSASKSQKEWAHLLESRQKGLGERARADANGEWPAACRQ